MAKRRGATSRRPNKAVARAVRLRARLYQMGELQGAARRLAERARRGSPKTARLLMMHFVERVAGADDAPAVPIDGDVARYFADAFTRFLDGKDTLESSLGLRKRRHLAWLNSELPDIARARYALEVTKGKRGAIDRT